MSPGACEAQKVNQHNGTPEVCRSFACPRRRSCVLYSWALSMPSRANICRSADRAEAALTPTPKSIGTHAQRTQAGCAQPGKSFAPGAVASSRGPNACTGHVAVHSLHQHPRTSLLPPGLFLRRFSTRTKYAPAQCTHVSMPTTPPACTVYLPCSEHNHPGLPARAALQRVAAAGRRRRTRTTKRTSQSQASLCSTVPSPTPAA